MFRARRRLPACLAATIGAALVLSASLAQADEALEVRIGIIARALPPPSATDPEAVPQDEGLAGARLALADSNTTGAFTHQHFTAAERVVPEGESPVEAARALAADGTRLLVLDLSAQDALAVADALKATGALLFNAAAPDDRLRGADCRRNLFHVAPSRAMLTDALAQFFATMRWRKLFLIVGQGEGDRLYADAAKRSVRKFGLQVTAEKPWELGPLARAKGDTPTTAEALIFSRGIDYDIAWVADEAGNFGDYLPFHTVDPRPVAGTQGLVAATWHPTLEVWGASQLQNRFRRIAGRAMGPLDYQVWLAVRSVAEAVSTSNSADPADIARDLLSPSYSLPGYKGLALSYRPWDHQLRQPLLVAQPRALVTVAPERGFLHQRTPLDTLGTDEPETTCKLD